MHTFILLNMLTSHAQGVQIKASFRCTLDYRRGASLCANVRVDMSTVDTAGAFPLKAPRGNALESAGIVKPLAAF